MEEIRTKEWRERREKEGGKGERREGRVRGGREGRKEGREEGREGEREGERERGRKGRVRGKRRRERLTCCATIPCTVQSSILYYS